MKMNGKLELNKMTIKHLNQLELSAINGGLQVGVSQATDKPATCCETTCASGLLPPGTEIFMTEGSNIVNFVCPNGYATFTGGFTEEGVYIPMPPAGPPATAS